MIGKGKPTYKKKETIKEEPEAKDKIKVNSIFDKDDGSDEDGEEAKTPIEKNDNDAMLFAQ